jgi:MinD-like ATPase involved in chromosome partitioning or flagellar assembly
MTRIFEALEQARTNRGDRPNVVDFPEAASNTYSPTLIAKLRDLYRLINRECAGTGGRLVQFIAARKGTGTTRISRALATNCAYELGKRALIIDTDITAPHFSHYGIEPQLTWADTLRRKESLETACYKVGRTGIHIMQAFRESQTSATVLESADFASRLLELRSSFDLILIDSAAAEDSSDGIDISTVADGTLLVIGAEKTRWQVAQDVRDRIEERGGHVIGVLLNEVRFHIPAPIYDRL